MTDNAAEPRTTIRMTDYDYELPDDLIAQEPVEPRDASRLLVADRRSREIEDRKFSDLPELLDPGDLVVLNDTRVRHARLHARRSTGGRVELLILDEVADAEWTALARPARRLRDGELLSLETASDVVIQVQRDEGPVVRVSGISSEAVERYGAIPLPPYIDRELSDEERYQTIVASALGSAAAPTAGLHFTPVLLDRLRERDIGIETVTLHVGLDTFRPVTVEAAENHEIHSEWYRIPGSAAKAIDRTRRQGNRVVAVGTTVVRTLETGVRETGPGQPSEGWSTLYITPPFEFQLVDSMITNFHLPRTTLLLLVSAFMGREFMFEAYEHAITKQYRFYSFGDAMIIL
ncbi:MAG: tRNA preQ1(34) S-adenosylmethionine ribosyltransferase-isomerase QueA [Chloroflexota bacterium]